MKSLALAELEAVYDALAEAINQAGMEKEVLFLTKLALLMANEIGSQEKVEELLKVALADL